MKKIFFLLVFVSMFKIFGHGQETVRMEVTGGDELNELLEGGHFLFSEFQDARVFLIGRDAQIKMNYNLLIDEMQFVDEKGDVLALRDKRDVVAIYFGKRVFKYSSVGYTEVIAMGPSGNPELAIKRTIKEVGRKNYGAYGTTSDVSNPTNITSSELNTKNITLSDFNTHSSQKSVSPKVTYQKENFYYLNSSGKYRIANRSVFSKVFSDKKKEIENYLKQNPVDYNNEEDVIRLFNFCTENNRQLP